MTMEKLFEQIKSARSMMKSTTEWKALSETTRRDYQQKYAALNGRLPMEAATCKRTYYGMRAAYLHLEAKALRSSLNELDKWRKVAVENNGGALKGTESGFMREVERLGIVERLNRLDAVQNAGPFMGAAKGTIQKTHGKRAVGKLPPQWKTNVLGAVPKGSKYRAHVAAMALCGCRPSEFENGVLVKQVDQDTYEFTIAGKKTGPRTKDGKTFTTGQSLRVLTISRLDDLDKYGQVRPEFIALDRAMNGKKNMELMAKANAIRDTVINASEKTFPNLDNKPTAYSFRHAFASELKATNGEDSDDTAAALGHASTKTQQGYGYAKSGGGGVSCKAKASDAIRTPHKTRKKALLKEFQPPAVSMPSPNAPKVPMPAYTISRKLKPSMRY